MHGAKQLHHKSLPGSMQMLKDRLSPLFTIVAHAQKLPLKKYNLHAKACLTSLYTWSIKRYHQQNYFAA